MKNESGFGLGLAVGALAMFIFAGLGAPIFFGEYHAPKHYQGLEIVQVHSQADKPYRIGVMVPSENEGEEPRLVIVPSPYPDVPRLGDRVDITGSWRAFIKEFFVAYVAATPSAELEALDTSIQPGDYDARNWNADA